MRLFTTGFLQVFFVACSTYFISHENYIGTFIVGFAISWLWSSNVKKISFGGTTERVLYASGAAVGSLVGLLASVHVFSRF
jgi:hypothetical protein